MEHNVRPVEPAEDDPPDPRVVASDPARPLQDRLDAVEDVFESEVGDTPLVRARSLERATGLRQIYLKLEGDNPTGTHKDRIAYAQAIDALRRGYEVITVATCGNYGAAIHRAAAAVGLRCELLIPEGYRGARISQLEAAGVAVVRVPGTYEDAVRASRVRAEASGAYDGNPGGANVAIQMRAYGEIAYEIYDELRDAPSVLAVPVSNGTAIAGIHRGFQSLFRRGKTSRIPRMVAGSSSGKNPIVESWRKGLIRCADLTPSRIRETVVNEPLVNWHAIDGDHALRSLRATRGFAASATDRRMKDLARDLREGQGLNVLPASTAGLFALLDLNTRSALPNDRYVAVLTGRES